MIRILLVILFLGIFNHGYSQNEKSKRQVRKEAKRIEKIMDLNLLGTSIESKKFSLEIENIVSSSGGNRAKHPMHNYIRVDSTYCIWQSNSSDIPTDLMSTVSKVEGIIDGWELEKDEKHFGYFLKFRMFTDNGLFRVTAYFNDDKTFTGTISGTRDIYTIYGRLERR